MMKYVFINIYEPDIHKTMFSGKMEYLAHNS